MKQGEEIPRSHDLTSPAGPGLGRRADQPRGVALVSRRHRRRPDAGRGHLVADRDGPDPDQPAARRDDHQAGLGHVRPARHRGRRRGRGGPVRPVRRRRVPRPQAAVAGHAPRHLRRPGAIPEDVLEPLPGDVLRGRRRQAGRGGLPLAARPRGRRHERRRPPDQHRRGRVRAGGPPLRGGGGRRRQVGRDQRPGDLRLRHPEVRARSRRTPCRSSSGSTSPTSSVPSRGPSS